MTNYIQMKVRMYKRVKNYIQNEGP